ncbi:MAG: hypothetical protein GW787_00240 [Betaproteobacteria bacterium]|nr:hypothetical protein [Betaproteobacteria bacterium]
MHFPDSKLPPVVPATDRVEVTPKAPIAPTRKVTPGFQETLAGGGGPPPGYHGTEPVAKTSGEPVAPYSGQDRRAMCRRIYHVAVLLDTRSGVERRRIDSY